MRVLFLAAEADPFVKIGGLGDVAGSLPQALRALKNLDGTSPIDVRLVIPYHGAIQRRDLPLRRELVFPLPYGDGETSVEVLAMDFEGLPVYFIASELIPPDSPVYSPDAAQDGLKFTFFSLAALEMARQMQWSPHLVHANDWHTSPAIYALSRMRPEDRFFRDTATLLGLHNLPYLGVGAGPALAAFGLPPAVASALPAWAQDLPLPLALLTADHIVAASPAYAREILTPEFGSGLHLFLRSRSTHISGILNGLDIERWNPETDPLLRKNFKRTALAERVKNKLSLQREFGLARNRRLPLIAMVSRLDNQKGVDLVPEALRSLRRSSSYGGWQAMILGSGDPRLESEVRRLESDMPDQVRAVVRFDAALSHRVYAGADLLLVPSRYEPCGLAQMIGMRYGCVPVGRATGGLRDTIQDYDQVADSTGFLFRRASPQALLLALRRALRMYYTDSKAWRGLQKRGMSRDFSWSCSANQYQHLYQSMIMKRDPDFAVEEI
jgi:starch synthase